MKTHSIATVSLSGALDEKLRAIAAAGFGAVEIFENDLLSFSGSPRDVGQMCRDLGLSICAFQPFRDFEGMPEPQRARNFARAERKFDLMQELQTDLMLICSNISPVSLGGIDRAAADFHELGERAAARGLRVGYEALAWGRHVNDYRDAWEIVRRADHKSIGIILDSFHALAPSFPTLPIQSIPADKIFLVQLADAPKLGLDVLSWSRHFRCFPGQGDLPIAAFMEAVYATGYAGPLSLEIFNDQFRAGSAVRTATDGLRSLILLDDDVRGAASAAPAPPLQPKAKSRGVGFIEFAVSEEKAKDLAALFGQLGFRKTGAHRSKDVERWSQGHIDLVINCEPDGFAHSHFVAHGPGVCAIAVDVDDASKTIGDLVTQGAGYLATFLRSLWSGGAALLSIFSLVVVTPVVAFYLICDWPRMLATVESWVPLPHRETVNSLAREIDAAIAGFVRGQTGVCLILGSYYALALTFARVPPCAGGL